MIEKQCYSIFKIQIYIFANEFLEEIFYVEINKNP